MSAGSLAKAVCPDMTSALNFAAVTEFAFNELVATVSSEGVPRSRTEPSI